MEYVMNKDLPRSLNRLEIYGGQAQRASEKVFKALGAIMAGRDDPFRGIKITRHGESRINGCVKYDLGNGYRLITVSSGRALVFCFVGDHGDCDKWLDRNRGLTIAVDNGRWEKLYKSPDIKMADSRVTVTVDQAPAGSPDRLLVRLSQKQQDLLLDDVPGSLIGRLYELDTNADDETILNYAVQIPDSDKADLLFDVLVFLRGGLVDEANARLRNYLGEIKEVEEVAEEEFVDIQDGENLVTLKVGSPEYIDWLKGFINTSNYQDWMLFMHPAQQKMVDANFDGSAKLSGVSGSGKTCVVVQRAVRLSKESDSSRILILTLNRSLSALIKNLVEYACPDKKVRDRIEVMSFFELCQLYLHKFEPENGKLYDDVTWKLNEHIDEVWREYYRCEAQNNDAAVMWSIHTSLNGQNINPEDYIRQELDWIRSALPLRRREEYLEIERRGRAVPLMSDRRQSLLKGLEFWEDKMKAIGVIDYLGLATSLHRHIDRIDPEYDVVLVDEAQDFGTLELAIVRKLVKEGPNDLFFAGDMAQHILPKHQHFKSAGINVPGARSHSIKKNYRNSREILKAAYHVMYSTLEHEMQLFGELEIQDPAYSNFSSPKPMVLKASSLAEEIAHARTLINNRISESDSEKKCCIAFAGFTMLEVQNFGLKLEMPVLDGTTGLQESNLFLSDLEQTKGYEFDTVCILNCNHGILPPANMPADEQFRDACRFYVAMTRAKTELIVSYSENICSWIAENKKYFEYGGWSSWVEPDAAMFSGIPEKLSEIIEREEVSVLDMDGRSFLYTSHAIGMDSDLQDKILELVDGRGLSRDGQRIKWPTIRAAMYDVEAHPRAKNQFGPEMHKRFLEVVKELEKRNWGGKPGGIRP